MKTVNTISYYSQQGFKGIPKREAEAEIKRHPEIIEYCAENFWKLTCNGECPHYQKCFSLNWQDKRGVFPIYPMNYKEATKC